jgi:hypothetical protein
MAFRELSKADKRIARKIIDKGLMTEFAKGLTKADKILEGWKQGKMDATDAYQALVKHISVYDKGISKRYDNISNDYLMFFVVQQLHDKVIDEQDLEAFSEDGKMMLQTILSL